MKEIEFQQGIRKANKAIKSLQIFPKKVRDTIAQGRAQRCLNRLLDDFENPSLTFSRSFYKGMFVAFSYYVRFGQTASERIQC